MFFCFAIHRGHSTGPDVELILHLVFVPLILLGKRNLHSLALLLPLRHEGTTTILGNELVFAHLLGLSLKLIVLTKCANMRLRTIRQASLAKLIQKEEYHSE